MAVNRIDSTFARLAADRRKALVTYICAGDPDLKTTGELVLAIAEAGADLIELGVPFSDPLADGVVNQQAAGRGIASGTTLAGIFDTVRSVRAACQTPIVLFSYYNPIFHHGLEKFVREAEAAGVDGVLILDFPPEEAEGAWPATTLKRISLIAPTTPAARIGQITETSSGFIYYVSREGVTGMQAGLASTIPAQVEAIRRTTTLPVCVGFGISNPEQARAAAVLADGVVVGSAIVHQIATHAKDGDLVAKVKTFVASLADAVHTS